MITDIKAPKNRKRLLKNCIIVVVFLLILQFFIHYTYKTRNPLVTQNIKFFQSFATDGVNEDADKPAVTQKSDDIGEKISWEDKKFVAYEERRRGPGEQGKFFNLSDPKDIQENENWHRKEGFFVIVSDKMSVDRSLPEQRPEA